MQYPEDVNQAADVLQNQRKMKNKNSRRFSDEQIRSLESIFELETKLEPKKKVKIARELGLQPRQIAIWFQNRRARWKSKRIEQEYSTLKASYDTLKFRFESVMEEKQALLNQLQKLNYILGRSEQQSNDSKGWVETKAKDGSENGDFNHDDDYEAKAECSQEGSVHRTVISLNNCGSKTSGCRGSEEGDNPLNKGNQLLDRSIASPEKWCSYESVTMFDQSYSGSHWWDIWT